MRLHDEAAPHCGGQTLLRASLHRCSRAAGCWCQGVQAPKGGAQHPQCHHEARKGKGRNIIIHVDLKKTCFNVMSMRTGETPPSATRKPSSFTTSSSTSCRLRPTGSKDMSIHPVVILIKSTQVCRGLYTHEIRIPY